MYIPRSVFGLYSSGHKLNSMELSVAEFKKVLGEDFNELKGTFEEQKFDGLLNELQFKQSILGRSKLRNVLNRRDSLKKVKYRLQKLLSPLKVGKVS